MNDPVSEFKAWFRSKPVFTRTYIASTFVLVIVYTFGWLGANHIYYDPTLTFAKLQLWRLFTSFIFFGKFSFNYLISAYFAYMALSNVQTGLFKKETYADFLWLVTYLWGFIILAATIFDLKYIGQPFLFAFLYIWCKREPMNTISFFFGLQVKSGYFPLVYMGFNVLMGHSLVSFLVGLFFGHLYIHIKDVLTVKYRKDYLPTPRFFSNFVKKYITKQIRAANAGGVNQRGGNAEPQQRFFGGQGYRLN